MGGPDPEKLGCVMQAMLKMKKIIVADLQRRMTESDVISTDLFEPSYVHRPIVWQIVQKHQR
jgi:hypothetical protein